MTESSTTLTHRLEGEAGREVVLLLNGGLMTYGTWGPVARHLGADFRRLFCDLRGQLLSPGDSHDDLSGHVDDVVALLDELDIARVHVLGTSFGAEVGLLLAATRPERVLSMIAATAIDYATPAILQGVDDMRRLAGDVAHGGDAGLLHDRLLEEAYSQSYIEANRADLDRRRSQLSQLPASWFRGLEGILNATENLDLRPHLDRIACPTLVVLAGLDAMMPAERSLALANAIEGAEAIEHPSSGHALVAEDPEWLGRTSLEFLSRVSVSETSPSTS